MSYLERLANENTERRTALTEDDYVQRIRCTGPCGRMTALFDCAWPTGDHYIDAETYVCGDCLSGKWQAR